MQVSISYFDQILGKRESQTRQVFNFAVIWHCGFVVLKLFVGKEFRENGQKSRKSQNSIPVKINTFNVLLATPSKYWWK